MDFKTTEMGYGHIFTDVYVDGQYFAIFEMAPDTICENTTDHVKYTRGPAIYTKEHYELCHELGLPLDKRKHTIEQATLYKLAK